MKQSTQTTLKQGVQQHYAAQQLDVAQLERLEALYQPRETQRPQRSARWYWLSAVAASLVLAVSLLLSYQPAFNEQRILAIAAEVAKEHLHQNPLEVSSADFSVVQQHFRRLDFLPNASRYFGDAEQLLGGRYCSIQSVSAAQIRYQSGGRPATLYQVPYDAARFGTLPQLGKGEQPLSRHVNGVAVQIWVENGLLMVSATEPDN